MPPEVSRLVVLGASNLAAGWMRVVSTAVAAWGSDIEVLAALGQGRSYGVRSRIGFRALPGILESGLWDELRRLPPLPTRGLLTDIGNDILYGFSAGRILAWVGEAVDRLQRTGGDIAVADLPLAGIRGLSRARFLFFRNLFYPRCRLSLAEVTAVAGGVSEGLATLSARKGLRLIPAPLGWYGMDPIHIRRSARAQAWQEMICGAWEPGRLCRLSYVDKARLSRMKPKRLWLCGVERHTPQPGIRLPSGGRVWRF